MAGKEPKNTKEYRAAQAAAIATIDAAKERDAAPKFQASFEFGGENYTVVGSDHERITLITKHNAVRNDGSIADTTFVPSKPIALKLTSDGTELTPESMKLVDNLIPGGNGTRFAPVKGLVFTSDEKITLTQLPEDMAAAVAQANSNSGNKYQGSTVPKIVTVADNTAIKR